MRASDLVGRRLLFGFRGQGRLLRGSDIAETQMTSRSQSCEKLKAMCVQERNELMLKFRGGSVGGRGARTKLGGAGARGR